ncbi:MAG: hypothetical protein AAF849_12770 [Bacteroidota bacterium]
MFARILLCICLFFSIIFLFYGFKVDTAYMVFSMPFVIAMAVIYVMSPQVNWWYYNKYPPTLDKRMAYMIQQQSAFFQQLKPSDRERFLQRVALCVMAHDFMPMVMEEIPEDLKIVFATNLVQLTFGQENFLLESKFEKIVIYPTPFPSPQFPKQFHSSEIYAEDGVMMFSAEHLMKGFAQPQLYYNSGMHEAIQAYLQVYPDKDYPDLPDDIWAQLYTISNFPEEKLRTWIGLEQINPMAVSMCHFLMFPERFFAVLPELSAQFKRILNY